MTNEYYDKYQKVKKTGPKQSREREKQNVLSGQIGWLTRPKDFNWLEKNIPCQAACPAGTDIPGYLDAIVKGDYDEAYAINLRDNVFPAVLGRVCTRPCEPACRHGWEGLGEPVAICFSKRSAADFLSKTEPVVLEPMFPPTGKSVTIIGAGAAGLAAARELALLGHDVSVLEQHDEPGGMMVQGIPEFRLPRELVRREIDQIKRCGVNIKCGVSIGKDRELSDVAASNDAVIIAAGTMKSNIPALPGVDLEGVSVGLKFLQRANAGDNISIGKRVVVIGGGFTAVDCARMAKRLGAEDVRMYYRRTRDEMYITPGEVEEMLEEGIHFETQVMPLAFEGQDGLQRVRLAKTEPGAPDEDGRRSFEMVPDSEFSVEADAVLLATGQVRDDGWLGDAHVNLDEPLTARRDASPYHQDPAGRAKPQAEPKSSENNLFLAGDFLDGAGSLIDAVASGKSCARVVDEFLIGKKRIRDAGFVENAQSTGRTREMDEIPRQPMPLLNTTDRSRTAEVETGFDDATAKTEASRCYLCNYKFEIDNDLCIYCDRCLKVKPVESCIVKISALKHDDQDRIVGYEPSTSSQDYNLLFIDQEQCIRCGACMDVCPVECITLQKVSKKSVVIGD